MAGMTTTQTSTHLTRANLWSQQLKDVLEDELMATKYVDWMSEFPDGTTFNVPTINPAGTPDDYTEDQAVTYNQLGTDNFTFAINKYKSSAHYLTRKALQDSFYGNKLLASFVPKESRAIMEVVEADVLATPLPSVTGGQTVDDQNAVNGVDHRFVAGGSAAIMALADFAYAKLALKKANVPMSNLVAIVDPSVAYTLETLSNLVSVSNNPQWEGIVSSGITTGMRFIKNVYGFDVYESNYLATPVDATTETTGGVATDMAGLTTPVQNLFFSAASGVAPILGAWRQMPTVDSEFNKDYQREEYITTCRYGVKLYRPENMVCVLSEGAV